MDSKTYSQLFANQKGSVTKGETDSGSDIITENKVFEIIYDYALRFESPVIFLTEISREFYPLSLSVKATIACLETLNKKKLIRKKISYDEGNYTQYIFSITFDGTERYIQDRITEYSDLFSGLVKIILKHSNKNQIQKLNSAFLSKALKTSRLIVNHILETLQANGRIVLIKDKGYNYQICEVSKLAVKITGK